MERDEEDYRYDNDDCNFLSPEETAQCCSCANEAIIKHDYSGKSYCPDCWEKEKQDAADERAETAWYLGGRS